MSAASREREKRERQKLLRMHCSCLPEPSTPEFDVEDDPELGRLYALFREHHPDKVIVLDGLNGQPVLRVLS